MPMFSYLCVLNLLIVLVFVSLRELRKYLIEMNRDLLMVDELLNNHSDTLSFVVVHVKRPMYHGA